MVRELRPRRARPSYATVLEDAGNDEPITLNIDNSSSDDFHPLNNGDEDDNDEDGVPDHDEDNESIKDTKSKRAGQHRGIERVEAELKQRVSTNAMPKPNVDSKTKLSRPNTRQNYVLPMPASDHRHRAVPLFRHKSRVERLVCCPNPFKPSQTVSTNNWTFNDVVTDRYSKAYGFNVGEGPIWELLEDRSWWKESLLVGEEETETEHTRRPRVHSNVKVRSYSVLSEEEAKVYLPTDADGNISSMKCSFGIVGNQGQRTMKALEHFNMSEYIRGAKSNVFNAGGPVWGLDWCPIYSEDQHWRSFKQYLAVAPFPKISYSASITNKCAKPFPACLQIWSFRSPDDENTFSRSTNEKSSGNKYELDEYFGGVTCEMVLCINCGPAREIKWCPLPSHDAWNSPDGGPLGTRKLGLLAGAFEDGSLSIFIVPDPDDVQLNGGPIYFKVDPAIRIELEDTSVLTLDWANSTRIAVGCSNGSFAVYDLKEPLSNDGAKEWLPAHYISVHQSAISSIQWIRAPSISPNGDRQVNRDPVILATGGFDGCVILTDLREGYGNLVNRTRDVVHALSYSTYSIGVITIDHENIVKVFTICPTMLGRGHHIAEAGGPIWALHSSDYHPQLAVGAADGSLLTTNTLKPTRRNTTPFLFYKIYQLDYSRTSGEYRMLEQFLPREIPDRSKPNREGESRISGSTGVWPVEVSVTRVVWNNGGGLGRASLLASATASGLCRIDWLLGHSVKERLPYGGIEYIRDEKDGENESEDEEDNE